MFKVDMHAIREAAIETWLTANPTNRGSLTGGRYPAASHTRHMVSRVATLAVSQNDKWPTDPVVIALLEVAMRACDYWGDSPAARAQMVADILALRHHQRQGWLEHFLAIYGKTKG